MLVKIVKEGQTSEVKLAAETLGAIGPAAKAAIPTLVVALRREDEDVRSAAALSLAKVGGGSKRVISALLEALLKALRNEESDMCIKTARALGAIGPAAEAGVPTLVKVLEKRKRLRSRLEINFTSRGLCYSRSHER